MVFNDLTINLLGIFSFTIAWYVLWGVIIALIGVLLAIFFPTVRKLGFVLFIIGLVMSVGFSLFVELWKSLIFKIIIIAIVVLIGVMMILFPEKNVLPRRRSNR